MIAKRFVFVLFTVCVLSVIIQGQTHSNIHSTSHHLHSTTPQPTHHSQHSTTARFYPQFCRCYCCAGYQCTPFLQGTIDYRQSGSHCTDEGCQLQCAIRYPTSCSRNIPYGTTNAYCDY